MATDFISRQTAISEILSEPTDAHYPSWYAEKLKQLPAADVVSRNCYDRILAENDTMREMLAQIGKKPGDKMDNVRPVVHGEWEDINLGWARCANCKLFVIGSREKSIYHFCPNCGADMRGRYR